MQSVGGKVVAPSLYVGSEGYGDLLDVQRIELPDFVKVVERRDLPDWYHSLAPDMVGNVIYDGLSTSPAKILRLNRETLDVEASLTLDPEDYYLWNLVADYTDIYVGLGNGNIIKCSKEPFEKVDSLYVGEDASIDDFVFDGNILYAIGAVDWLYDRVYKIDLNTFTLIDTLNVPATWYGYTSIFASPIIHEGYLYYIIPITYTLAGRIAKINLETFTFDSFLVLGANDRTTAGLVRRENYLYTGTQSPTPKIIKVDLTTWSKVDELVFPTGDEWLPRDIARLEGRTELAGQPFPENRLYALTYWYVVEVDLDTFTRTGRRVAIDSTEGYYPICIILMP